MKKRCLQLLCVLVALLLPAAALAEELVIEPELVEVEETAEAAAEEIDGDLPVPVPEEALMEAEALTEAETPSGEDSPEYASAEAELPEAALAASNDAAEQSSDPVFDDPLDAVTLSVTKSAKKTVYLSVPYVLNVKGDIKSVKSSASSVADASADGVLTLKKKGTAKLTIKTGKSKKFVLTLTVKSAPAPTGLKVKTSNGAMKLSWTAADYATSYLVQQSQDGSEWSDFERVSASKKSTTVTKAVSGTTWLRVVAILGDRFGGASASMQVLGPLSGVKVICEEAYKTGPTDRMNVVWKGCEGAEEYVVYHALAPSEKFVEIGRTSKSYFPVTRSKTKLDVYKVMPVFGDLELAASDPVTLWTGYQSNVLPPSSLTSSTGIILVVNKKAQVVTAYGKDADGKYTVALRHMICSTGKDYDRTRNGTYKLKARKGQWYKYPSGCYIRWPSIYRDGYYFHSVLYKSKKKIYTNTIEQLGTRRSLGCIRLKVNDANWVYKNCPKGTAVYICDGKKLNKLKSALYPRTVRVSGF